MRRLVLPSAAFAAIVLLAGGAAILTACSEPAPPTATSEPTATAPRETAAPVASPSPTPAQQAAAPVASPSPAPAPTTAEPTPTPTASPATGSRTVVVTTREEGVEEEAKGSGGLTPTDPKPPRTESTPTAAPVAARAADAGTPEKEERPYTWYDGDRIRKVWLHSDGAEPVFRTESGELMTLPGGVVLVLDASWDEAAVEGFFAEHGIARSSVTEQSFGANAFLVDTEPGFPSLELANTLAMQDGVRISSPNWRREVETR